MQRHAQPLVDTPDDVINAALDALDQQRGKKVGALTEAIVERRRHASDLTPQKEFRIPLLKTLYEIGGRASAAKIREVIERKIAPALKRGDTEQVSSGDPRWWNAICWERADLVREGLFRSDSPRGTWELSERGKAEAKKL